MAAKREQEEEQCESGQCPHQPPSCAVTKRQRGEQQRQRAHVLGVELDRVGTPVVFEHAVELRQQEGEHFRRRQRIGARKGPALIGSTIGARRERDVRKERQHLHGGDAKTDGHCGGGETERGDGLQPDGALGVPEHEVERPEPERDHQEVGHVEVTQDDQRHHDREQAERPRARLADGDQKHPERQRRERGHEQLAVVTGTHLRGHDTRQLIRHTCDHRRCKAEPQRPPESIGEPAREHEVQRHRVRDGQVRRHDPSQPRGRVEDVAVHRADQRQSTKQEGVPLRDCPGLPKPLGPEQSERVAGNEHVGPAAAKHDVATEQRPEQEQCCGDADRERGKVAGSAGVRIRRGR